ncbi:hypothetical protein GLOIN_2v1869728 [Rhizophagus irregularis DAOM 181602=DAOM 197198]|nr:hypothetical protein GLOIN_2v1869728 [Rhizophagus irregularis DAOM 181602=DAOM 197198]
MDNSSSQSESSSSNSAQPINNSISNKTTSYENISNNIILLKLEEDGFTTPDGKAKELIKELSEIKYLYALKLLFENPLNRFTPKVLRDSLVTLADPKPFDYYDIQSVTRLELHLRTWVAVLEKICFTQMRLSKDLRNRIYNSLPKFVEIHRKTTQIMQEGIDNKYISDFNQFNHRQINNDDDSIKKRNYNIDFLLIHLRDTLHSLRDDETWFQEIIRRTKNLLKAALNITPGILLIAGVALPNDNSSILLMLTQIRESLSFKYPVASYYVDWRIMLIIQHNLFTWSENPEMIISNKFSELREQTSSSNIIDIIANEMTCPVSSEPEDQLCILKCQHTLSLNNLKKLKQKICSECREKIEEDDIRYLSQNSIYKYLYTKFSESGHILPSIELENSDQIYDKAINLKPKEPIAYLICGEIFFWQGDYDKAVDNLKISINYKVKINNSYIIIGNSYLFKGYYYYSIENYNIALENNPNNYSCLKNSAYSYEKRRGYLKDINNAVIEFKKYKELFDFNDILSKTQLFHLEYLLNKNNSTELNNILTKINQISNIKECIVDFWPLSVVNNKLGIVNGFSKHMYEKSLVYFMSNLVNLDNQLHQFQENDINSLSEKDSEQQEHILKHEDVLKIVGLGWIEYQLPINIYECEIQLSIEINGSINMQIDYVRFGSNNEMITCIPNME